jgi:hypothetical protein
MAKRGRPANIGPDGTRRKTRNKSDGRIVHQLWLRGDSGKKQPTATWTEGKVKGRKRGAPRQLTVAQRAYLNGLVRAFDGTPAFVTTRVWKALLHQIAEPRPRMSDVDAIVADLVAVGVPPTSDKIGTYGVTFNGVLMAPPAGKHYSGHWARLIEAMARDPENPDNGLRKRRLLAEMRKRWTTRKRLAAAILARLDPKHSGKSKRVTQKILDLVHQRPHRKSSR